MTGHYLALVSENGDINAALPIFEVRSWLTGHRLVSLPYATLCDPLIKDRNEFELLAKEAIALADRLGARSFEIRTHLTSEFVSDQRFGESLIYKHHFLSLERDDDVMMKSFDRTCVRQRIQRAVKSNFTLQTVENESQLSDFYTLYVHGRKHLGLPPQPYKFIRLLWNNFAPSGAVEILTARLNGQMIAAILMLKYRDRVSVEYSAHDEQYRNVSPVHFLFWEAIKLSRSRGFRIFDFGRTEESNQSLMDFKRHWGTTIVDLPEYYFPKGRMEKRRSESFEYRMMRNLCRVAPPRLLPSIGKFCYRHLG